MKKSAKAWAPARANLLGEHTDYNHGYVLPTPLEYRTSVAIDVLEGLELRIKSLAFKEDYIFDHDVQKTGNWSDYVTGCLELLKEKGISVPGMSIEIDSNIPIGMGISSSAALTVSTLRALRDLLELDIDDFTIAEYAHAVEKHYVGVPCGIMDQMVCSTGQPGKALFLDTQSLAHKLIPLPEDYKFRIVHSGLTHQLKEGDSGYKQRVEECRRACELLNITSLRAVDDAILLKAASLPNPLNRRVLHVYSENQRVQDGARALEQGDVDSFAKLMVESHQSQRDNYEVSIPKIDEIVAISIQSGALGARLTGGGFGGSVVSLVHKDKQDEWWEKLSAECKNVTLL